MSDPNPYRLTPGDITIAFQLQSETLENLLRACPSISQCTVLPKPVLAGMRAFSEALAACTAESEAIPHIASHPAEATECCLEVTRVVSAGNAHAVLGFLPNSENAGPFYLVGQYLIAHIPAWEEQQAQKRDSKQRAIQTEV